MTVICGQIVRMEDKMTTKKRTTTRRRAPARKPPTPQQVRNEVFWTLATIALIVATVIFVPMLFAAVK